MKPKRRNLLPWLKSRLRRLQSIKHPTGRQLDRMDDLIFEIRKREPRRRPSMISTMLVMAAAVAWEPDPYRRAHRAAGGHIFGD